MKLTLAQSLTFITTFVVGIAISTLVVSLSSENGDVAAIQIPENNQSQPVLGFVEFTRLDSPIRRVDFDNFDYPGLPGLPLYLRVRNGKRPPKRRDAIGRPLDISLVLADVTYGDVTGDGQDDAIVDLGWETGGTASADLIYIFTMRKTNPHLLWAFKTGDRADGGCRNVFAENGLLIVELLGKDKIIGKNLYADDGTHSGLCCPTVFTRSRYRWIGNRFRLLAPPEVRPL